MSAGRPRVLFVYPKSPVPDTTGNRRRLRRLLQAAERHFDVTLLVVTRDMGDEDRDALEHVPIDVEIVELRRVDPTLRQRLRWFTGAGPPIAWHDIDADRARQEVGAAIGRHRPDGIFCSAPILASMVLANCGTPVSLDISHIERTVIDGQLRAATRNPSFASTKRAAVLALDRRARLRNDAAALRNASLLLPVSDVELHEVEGRYGTHATVVLNGVDLPNDLGWQPGSRRLLYVANFGYPPNAEALRILASRILPNLRALDAAVELHLAGPGIADSDPVRQLPGVVVHGFVPDLADVYGSAELVVAPLMTGSGTKLKIVEAFGFGVPVVTTPKGAEGLPFRYGTEAEVASTVDELVRCSADLLSDPERAERQRDAARLWVEEGYAWESIGDQFCAALDAMMGTEVHG